MEAELIDCKKRHIGRNIRKIREYMGIKQEAIALDLGITQREVSKIEQQEEVEEEVLTKIAKSIGVPVELIKNFDLERAFYNINNYNNNTFEEGSTAIGHQFNPIEKIVELYERLLTSEREKIEILTKK